MKNIKADLRQMTQVERHNNTNIFMPFKGLYIYDSTDIWAFGHKVLFRSNDYGYSWEDLRKILPYENASILEMSSNNGMLFCFAKSMDELKVILSDDGGNHWKTISNLAKCHKIISASFRSGALSIAAQDSDKIAIYNSYDYGLNWKEMANFPTNGLLIGYDYAGKGKGIIVINHWNNNQRLSEIILYDLINAKADTTKIIYSNIQVFKRSDDLCWYLGDDKGMIYKYIYSTPYPIFDEVRWGAEKWSISAIDIDNDRMLVVSEDGGLPPKIRISINNINDKWNFINTNMNECIYSSKIMFDSIILLTQTMIYRCSL
jgi:hypothetical protein